MQEIKRITLKKEEYEYLINNPITRGGEAVITNSSNFQTRYKLFKNIETDNRIMSGNKINKIKELYKLNIPFLVKPISLIYYDNNPVGYEMSYVEDDITLFNYSNLKRKDMIKILKELEKILGCLKGKGIIYGDVTADNILINQKTGMIKLCDIDNICLGEYLIDTKGYGLSRYYEATGVIDDKVDAYMHNLLTIKMLSSIEKYESEILMDLRKGNYPKKFKQQSLSTFESMQNPNDFNGEYIINYVKR